jgi:hypothetical protein
VGPFITVARLVIRTRHDVFYAPMKRFKGKRVRRRGVPGALDQVEEAFDLWIEATESLRERASETGRHWLTDIQLKAIEKAVEDCRNYARRSADSRLPPNAGEIVREALRDLLAVAESQGTANPASRQARRKKARSIDEASRRVEAMRGNLVALVAAAPFDFPLLDFIQETDENLERLSDRLSAMKTKALRPARKGRRRDAWMHAFLIRLTVWWYRQGWTPTSSESGAYLQVVTHVLGFRRGLNGPVAPLDHSAVVGARRAAKKILDVGEEIARIRDAKKGDAPQSTVDK